MFNLNSLSRAFLAISIIGPCSVVPYVAAAEGSATLEEIVVTARKREESLQDTPLAVTAFGARDLEQRNINGLSEVSRYMPNIQFDNVASESGGGSSSQIAIRGIGQTDYVITIEPGVGLYLDGVYIGKSVGSLIDNVDIERVEVLRGPQGTLFGRNTIGGAVSVISKRPSEEFEAYVDATVGRYDRRDLKASVSGAVTDNLRLRFSGATQNRDGHVRRVLTGDREGDKDNLFGRLVAEMDFSENFRATASFDITDANEEQAGQVLLRADENGFFSGLHNTVDFPACDPALGDPARFSNANCFNSQWVTDIDDLKNYSRGPSQSDTKVWGTGLTLDWEIGDYSLKSITAFRKTEVDIVQDLAPNPIIYSDVVSQDIELESMSQEFQFFGSAFEDRLNYVIGLFWLNEEGSQEFGVKFDPVRITSGGSIDNTSKAIFAQGTYDITDRLSLTVGARYSEDEIKFRPEQSMDELFGASGQVLQSIFTLPGTTISLVDPGTPILPSVWVESDESNFSPAVTLSYDLTEEVMAYATYSEGYKAGGFTMRAFPAVLPGITTPITDPNQIIPAFGPEEVEQYEIGLKSQLFDNRLRLNLAAFLTNYDDLQLLALTGVGGLVPVIFNAGDARLWGAEAEIQFVVNEWLQIDGSLGWLDHKYESVDPNTAGVTKDSDLANAPDWNASLGATVNLMDNEYGSSYLRVDWSYKGDQFKDPTNEKLLEQDSYSIVNAALSWESGDGRWLTTLGVTNQTDEIYIVSGIDNDGTGITAASPSRPREWFAKVKYNF